MKVKAWVETAQEVDVEISLDDVIAEIASMDAPSAVHEAQRLVNTAYGALRRVPAEVIALMSPGNRRIISDALVKEAARYAPDVSAALKSIA